MSVRIDIHRFFLPLRSSSMLLVRFTGHSRKRMTMPRMSITVRQLSKCFRSGSRRCCALDNVDLDVADGEMVALIGPSGSGKSTLLRHIAGLVAGDPGDGSIRVGDAMVQRSGRIARNVSEVRCHIGFVFQQFNLVGRLDVLTNVLAGAIHRQPTWRTLPGLFPASERLLAMRCLERVGMDGLAAQRASTLSGGQQQRVAIARTMLQGASTVLADEPIASLDPSSAKRVMETLARINREDGTTVMVSLHQVDYARAFCPRTIAMRAGRVVYDGPTSGLSDELLHGIYHDELDAVSETPAAALPTAPLEPALA
jgi:phosphonate transport system ATP-binding protein